MSDTKFTLPKFSHGEWHASEAEKDLIAGDAARIFVGPKRSAIDPPKVLASVFGKDWKGDGSPPEVIKEAKFNAYLIAAAPDLFRACRAAEHLMPFPSPMVDEKQNLLQMLRAALAKAEGR